MLVARRMSSSITGTPETSDGRFLTTHWSVVLSARQKDSPEAGAALEALCRAYWYPLYAFVRRQGHSAPDAQDLTQEFFARLLQKDYLQAVAREKGKFRSFLLVALKRFLANDWRQSRAQKRGGGFVHVTLEVSAGETRYLAEPGSGGAAETLYERRWATTLLDLVLERLRLQYVASGKGAVFEQLKDQLMAERGALSYADAASRLGLSEGAVKVAAHRLRRRFRELFREEVGHTVSTPEEIDDEIRHLLAAFGS